VGVLAAAAAAAARRTRRPSRVVVVASKEATVCSRRAVGLFVLVLFARARSYGPSPPRRT
jgi:hypothetical protein